jgi:hypothetical protein
LRHAEQEIVGKTVEIALNRLIQNARRHAVNPREISVQNHPLIAERENQTVNLGKMDGGGSFYSSFDDQPGGMRDDPAP